jgi:ATP-dependent Clp protease, protease subunit
MSESPSQSDAFQLQMIDTLLRQGLYLPTSTYFIDGEVTPRMAGDLVRALHILEAIGEPITIHLSTPGGDMTAGLDMYDAIKACDIPITIIGRGEVMSMGAVILQAAPVRLLTPNTTVLVHVGYGHTGSDLPENIVSQAKSCKRLSDRFYSIIGRRIGLSRQEMLERFRWDTFLTASQAVKLGLADGIKKSVKG